MYNTIPTMITKLLNLLLLSSLVFSQGLRGQTTEVTYYVPDALGSPIAAMDEAGTIKWRKHYQPFGKEIEQGAASQDNRIGYTGHVHDRASGLTYMGARYYDPEIGRFLSMDPAAVNPNDPRTFNRYAYAANNPYTFVDPDGRVFMFALPFIFAVGEGTATAGLALAAAGEVTIVTTTAVMAGVGGAELISAMNENGSDDGNTNSESPGVDKDNPPNHPDFVADKKKIDKEKIPWNKNRKGFKDKKGNYWEPVPDGHKGTHDPHWDVQKPDGSHTPVYPPKN